MLPPIPVLSDYGISPARGFLPGGLPLTRLPDPYYNKWEAVTANLQALILSGRLRGVIDRLPVLSTTGLEHDAEWRRAYSLLIFMAHGYIWGGDSPSERLPPAISVPLLAVAEHLEVPPVATYAGLCLWNFKPLFVDEDIDDLDNLATLNTFTGSSDESWFYLVSVAIEARGAPIMPLMLTAIAAAREGDTATVTRCLHTFAERLDDLGTLLHRMNEHCHPTIFYDRIRPFLAGSKNMAEAGLPNGVLYEVNDSGRGEYRQYSGGSNAQSSIIQFFDLVLGVEHRPTGLRTAAAADSSASESDSSRGRAPAPRHNFIMEMRKYMPGPHARFLNDVASVANIRGFVEQQGPHDQGLRVAYDACLAMLSKLRDRHIAIVTRYIVTPSKAERARSRSRSPEAIRQRVNLATASRQPQQQARTTTPPQVTSKKGPQGIALDTSARKDLKGTGGTQLMSFLKQARDETGDPAVSDWARRFMSRLPRREGRGDFFLGKEELPVEEVEVAGLAGTWTMEDDFGGICITG
ncbi:Indoleamine 2,3-dioxygenase [Cryphonectria parasitica EP155]|uniref:Indoleamine 2,3-dioxygenase n=1 Tax=Cryphonectria parasitica (strain ATCC 38755 / EP155) TaxID=660469 RepID=A0A9P5CK98_CRYP1|nr:Indoleamine 2,3-dioxygenase [Cryphonectria parasitica EP155]KAF3760967.1 Indoleamine 2,3-dioxygenase [Cryphonectria parasitica EP155]